MALVKVLYSLMLIHGFILRKLFQRVELSSIYRSPAPGAPPFVKPEHSSTQNFWNSSDIDIAASTPITRPNKLAFSLSKDMLKLEKKCENFIPVKELQCLWVGDKVQKGKIICIIEAMKLMDEIEVRSYCTDVNLDASVDAMEVAGEE
ncbi:hypothetical protein FXO38_23383 [Capsicum annuum]|nr:hypothetical protein FXO38_23383 [Capsicum annuum]KAF3641183.1 hypothetical protein FXO37_23118 [Capsicum annuum]